MHSNRSADIACTDDADLHGVPPFENPATTYASALATSRCEFCDNRILLRYSITWLVRSYAVLHKADGRYQLLLLPRKPSRRHLL
jgi:hypothetical protein